MSNIKEQVQQLAFARRLELIGHVYQSTHGRVHTGPFKGMTIVPKVSWGDGDIGSKLLGLYEDELHKIVIQAVTFQPDLVVNIGCAEGYYALGLARLLPNSEVIAVDIDSRSTAICKENSEANQLTNVQVLTEKVDTAWLIKNLQDRANPLLFVDCEGAELELLDPSQILALKNCSIVVESHDCIIAGITDTLKNRFEATHTVEIVRQQTKDPYQFKFLDDFSDCDKWILVHEGRPSTMSWLYITPKNLQQ